MTIVRLADLKTDALAILEAAKDFISRMDYTAYLPETEEEFVEALDALLTHECTEAVVAEHDGQIVGVVVMTYVPCDWNLGLLIAAEKMLWCAEDAPSMTLLRMLRFTEARMVAQGAKIKEFGTLTSSPTKLRNIYGRMGMRPVQTMWMGDV